MKFTIKIPYDIKNNQESAQTITSNLILTGINSKYPNGIDGAYRKTLGRLQRKLDEATDKGAELIEIESDEYDLIKNSLNDGKFPPILAKHVLLLEEYFEKVSKE